jgi:hypothetical protein
LLPLLPPPLEFSHSRVKELVEQKEAKKGRGGEEGRVIALNDGV